MTVSSLLFVKRPGIIVCNGLLFDSIQLGWFSSNLKFTPRFWNKIPEFSEQIPLPNPWQIELIKETAFRLSSTTVKYTVSGCEVTNNLSEL